MKKILLFIFCCITSPLWCQHMITTLNTPYQEDFNGLAATGTSDVVPVNWYFLETGTNANTTYTANNGTNNAGNTYSYGATDAADRAFGLLQSGSLIGTIGSSFQNNTGSTITALTIRYTGEFWRLGATSRADRLDFQYSLTATSLATGTWTDVNELDFETPDATGSIGARDGNAAANRRHLEYTITGLSIPPGSVFWIRWTDFNAAGADDGLAVDDFELVAEGQDNNTPLIGTSTAALNLGTVVTGNSRTLSYTVTGTNVTQAISVETTSAAFSVSVDNATFTNSATLPPTGGTVWVRYTPSANGAESASVLHTSGTASATVTVSGTGYDPLVNIIAITTARSRPAGTLVTVTGRITVANEHGSPSFIQDATGGIPVFSFPFSNAVAPGDSVIVTGPIGFFNDQVQISGNPFQFTIVPAPRVIPAPKVITLDQMAAHEGLLVTVSNVELVNKNFVFFPQSTELMRSGSTQGDLRIDGDTDIPGLTKPQGAVDITGVVGRFRTNAQLLPRFASDIPGAALPETPADTIDRSQTLDVVTWNVEFFGARLEDYGSEYGPADEELQRVNIRKVLDSLRADIIAVQEISDINLFASLVRDLGSYRYTCSNRFSYSFEPPSTTFPPQQVCFIYDTTTVKVVTHRAMFEQLYDVARLTDPSLLPSYPTGNPSSFWSSGRLPYMLVADVTIGGVTERIHLVNVHAKSGSAAQDRLRRMYDVAVLKDSLDTHYADANIIFLGDYNDDVDVSINAGNTSSYQPFVDDVNYSVITKALSDAGARSTTGFTDMIDHITISGELTEAFLEGSQAVVTPFRLIPNYASTTSDHLAVMARFQFRTPATPTLQFAMNTAAATEGSGKHTVVITLTPAQPVDVPVTVTWDLRSEALYGLDYITTPTGKTGSIHVTIPAGAEQTSFTVEPLFDRWKEGDETVTFRLAAEAPVTIAEPSTLTFTILDGRKTKLRPVFYLYPNPGRGPVRLVTDLTEFEGEEITATLYTTFGKMLFSSTGTVEQITAHLNQVLDGHHKGLYYLKIVYEGEEQTIRVLRL